MVSGLWHITFLEWELGLSVRMIHFHFINIVWGDSYIDLFLNASLPTQLTSGNLLHFGNEKRTRYTIYTTLKDAKIIKNSLAFHTLSDLINTKIVLIDEFVHKEKYITMTQCHRQAIQEAKDEGAALVFLHPDCIWPDGSFTKLANIARMGKRVVLHSQVHVVKETFFPVLLEIFSSRKDLGITFSSHTLFKLALKHLHPFNKSLCWDATHFEKWPSQIYWKVGNEGFLVRCFYMHPLMVIPSRGNILPSGNIDDGYISTIYPNWNDIHIVDDSDEIFNVAISDTHGLSNLDPAHRLSPLEIARWAQLHTTTYHQHLFQHKIRIHDENPSKKWRKIEKHSDKIVAQINFWFKFLNHVPKPLFRNKLLKNVYKQSLSYL